MIAIGVIAESAKLHARARRCEMNVSLRLTIGAAVTACLFTDFARAQVHPDPSRYEYLYASGRFVEPYNSFPSGRERSLWKCFDAKSQVTFDCTFVRGGFEQFKYIFRPR